MTNPIAAANDLKGIARIGAFAGLAVVGFLVGAVIYALPGIGDFLVEKAPFGILVVGAIRGTITALIAFGLILIYRTNRFVHFGYASMGSLGGVLALALHFEHGVPYFATIPIGVGLGVAVGALTELLIRRFRHSSRLIVTVASIGLAQIYGVIELFGAKGLGFVSLASGFSIPLDVSINVGVKTLFSDEILIMACVPVAIAGLAWFLLATDAGVAIRASAENEDRALLLGIPVHKLGRIVWMIAGGLAALTFILQAPSSGIAPGAAAAGPIVLLPALAAAVVARMESLPVAFVTGIALGVVEQLVRWNSETPSFTSIVFLGIILVALFLQRASLSRAMNSESASFSSEGIIKAIPAELRPLREIKIATGVLLTTVLAVFVLVPATWGPSNQFLAAIAMVWAMVAVSLVMLTGWGGHISLGQFAIAGMGGLLAGNLLQNNSVDFFVALLAAGAAGGITALVVGVPALRIRGLFLAVTTLAFAVTMDQYILNDANFPNIIPSDITRPLLWERFDLEEGYPMYLVCLSFLVLSLLVARSIRNSRAGRVMIATRDNERAAASTSVPVTQMKLASFMTAGFIAGVAGGLHVTLLHSLNPGTYDPAMSLEVFATSVIGGLSSLPGAVAGVLFFQYLSTLTWLAEARPLVSGAGLVFVLLAFPGGLAQLAGNQRDKWLTRIADKHGILVPSLVADKRVDDADDAAAPADPGLLGISLDESSTDKEEVLV